MSEAERTYTPNEARIYLEGYNAALRAQEQNEPLTLEQVKMRVRVPVWYENIDSPQPSGWRIVSSITDMFIGFENGMTAWSNELGRRYRLYAHEPKGADQ